MVSHRYAIKCRKKAFEEGWTERTLVDRDTLYPWPNNIPWGKRTHLKFGGRSIDDGPFPLWISTTEIIDTLPKGRSWVWDEDRQCLMALPPKNRD